MFVPHRLLPHPTPLLLELLWGEFTAFRPKVSVFWSVGEPLPSPPCPPPSFLLRNPDPHRTGGDEPHEQALQPPALCVAEPGLPSRFPPCSTTTPRQVVLAALGMLEETCQASSLCCNWPCFFPYGAGVSGAIPSPAALGAGAGEADEGLSLRWYFPATLAASGLSQLLTPFQI